MTKAFHTIEHGVSGIKGTGYHSAADGFIDFYRGCTFYTSCGLREPARSAFSR